MSAAGCGFAARPSRKPPFPEDAGAGPDLAWLEGLDGSFDGAERGGIDPGSERVAGRLREHADVWRENTSDPFVLRVLEHGLELPFEDGRYPAKSHASRNFIKDDDLEWVRGTVVELLAQGAVSRWSDLAGELAAAGIEVTPRISSRPTTTSRSR